MREFHATLHVLPADHEVGSIVEVDGCPLQTLQIPQASLCEPFAVTFEEVFDALEVLPRMFVELDGCIVWRGESDRGDWQLDGQLSDRNGRLLFVELKGTVDETSFGNLLSALGWPQAKLVFQLVRTAVQIDEEQFRRYAFG